MNTPVNARPRLNVTLIVETAMGSGRNILRGIARYSRQHGPWMFHHEWRNTDLYFPPWLEDWEGDGFIARVESPRIAKALQSFGVPVVDVLGTLTDTGFPLVRVDDVAIARTAAEHLLDRGFRHYAFCGVSDFSWSTRRRDAFVAAVSGAGFECRVHEIGRAENEHLSWETEQQDTQAWLQSLPKPTGIMLCNDLHGHFILDACLRDGIAVPDEIAVVGVDNDEPICEVSEPPLSSVKADDERVGYEAARLLDRLMDGESWNGKSIYIPPRGVRTRLSTDSLAIEEPSVVAAIRFIREHARDGITVADVVRAVPVSRTLLQRRFRAERGRSMHDEIASVRLNHARFLLEEGDMPISLVAEKSGFKHQEYMGAVFKKQFGQTPLQYRQRSRLPNLNYPARGSGLRR